MEKYLYTPNNSKDCVNLWMAYPACESFALASLGYMWLSKIAEEDENFNSQRVYTDSNCFSKKPDVIAFSMSFDFDFMGVFEILEKNNIPFFAADRREGYPLIFAGGPVITANPEPYKRFFDFMIIGDGELVFKKVLEILAHSLSKEATLKELSQLAGVYVPGLSKSVVKVTESLENVIYTPIISDKSYFANTFIIEVSRGCMNRCAFCTASYLNLPFRSYDYKKIIDAIDLGLQFTNKIALLGAQISAHPQFIDIMRYIEAKMDSGLNIELGISSLRTDSVTPELVKILVKGGQKNSTIAIEAASERLRKFINKNLKEEQILDAVRIARENGLQGLKVYSMIGLPSETQEDIDEFIRLAKHLRAQNKGFNLTFSFSSFVPKPQTPLQWMSREDTRTLEKKQKYLEKELTKVGIGVKFSSIKWDYWQSLISRGDDSLADFLVDVYKNGGKVGAYKSALKSFNIDILKFINGFEIDDKQPWDFIENYPDKNLLLKEYKRLAKYM